MAVIPFYGATDPEMFAIERGAMDQPGRVIKMLDTELPNGLVLDVGAGDGFTAEKLQTPQRRVFALEPAAGMIEPNRPCTWVRGDAEHLPFAAGSFTAAYATWAYFFSRNWDPTPGIAELHRVVAPGGPLVIVDNAGGDEFCNLTSHDISADADFWRRHGFSKRVIATEFRFETLTEAAELLGFYFGARGREAAALSVEFCAAVFTAPSAGPGGAG
jgi:SAM-dependent methyltransferase